MNYMPTKLYCWLITLQPLTLKRTVTYDEVVSVAETPQVEVDRDALLDELVLLQSITDLLSSEMSVEERWVKVFNSLDKTKLTNIFRTVSFVLSIPASNAVVERIFSVMTAKWSDTRNRASVELIKNELFVYFNCSLSCSEFYSYCLGDKKLLQIAKSIA